jgi:hypothetical protein
LKCYGHQRAPREIVDKATGVPISAKNGMSIDAESSLSRARRAKVRGMLCSWDVLTRSEQRLIVKLFGGGSLRNESAATIDELCVRGLIDDNGQLTTKGLEIFKEAYQRQEIGLISGRGRALVPEGATESPAGSPSPGRHWRAKTLRAGRDT